jgi:hypothetical protein
MTVLRPARALFGALLSTLGALACADASRPVGPETPSVLGTRHTIANITDGSAVMMKSRLGSGYCAAGASTSGSDLTSTNCLGTGDQQFTWQPSGEVKAYGSMCITAVPATATAAARVVLQSCDGSAAQKWALSGPGEIRNASNQCVAANAAVETPGARLVLKSCDGTLGTMWEAWGLPSGATVVTGGTLDAATTTTSTTTTVADPSAVMMKSRLGSGYCAAGASAAGSALTANGCQGAADEQAVWQSTGEVKLYGTMCVTAVTGTTSAVQLLACDGRAAQKWTFSGPGEIRNASGQCVAADAAAQTAGSKLLLRACDGTLGTMWEKWPVPGSTTSPAPAPAPAPAPMPIATPPAEPTPAPAADGAGSATP